MLTFSLVLGGVLTFTCLVNIIYEFTKKSKISWAFIIYFAIMGGWSLAMTQYASIEIQTKKLIEIINK